MLESPLRVLVFPLGATGLNGPDDTLGTEVAASIVNDTPLRQRISRGSYINTDPDDPLGRVLNAYRLANETKDMRDRLHEALRNALEMSDLGSLDLDSRPLAMEAAGRGGQIRAKLSQCSQPSAQ